MKFSLLKLIMLAIKTSIYIFVLSAFLFQLALASETTGQNLEKVSLSINIKNAELTEVFDHIAKKTDFTFAYDPAQLKSVPRQDYQVDNQSLKTIFYNLSRQHDLKITRVNKVISVKRTQQQKTQIQDDIKVSGTVKDEDGLLLPGATVQVVGLSVGTITDMDGRFQLEVPDGYSSLSISYIGYQTATYQIDTRQTTDIRITLIMDISSLQEVVVIGYGQNSRKEVATSVVSVTAKDLRDQPVISLDEAIAGKMAGVQVSQTSGAPGSGFNIRVRGTGTITAGSSPLYVVDGVPLSDRIQNAGGTLESYSDAPINPLNSININDIESITVLKDAAAAAIYGSRGANGVVLITTKKGQSGKPRVNLESYVGFQNVTKKIDMLDAYGYANLKYDGHNNAYLDFLSDNGLSGSINDPNSVREANGAGAGDFKIPSELIPYVNDVSGLTNTDWQDAIFRTGAIQSHTLSVSGGNENIGYYLSGTFLNQEGVVISSGYQQYSVRLNLNANYEKVNFGVNFSPSRSIHDRVKAEGPYWADGVIGTALVSSPMFPVYDADGSFDYGQQNWRSANGENWSDSYINPVALAELMVNDIYHNRTLGNAYFEYKPLEGLSFKTNIGVDINNFTRDYFRPKALPNRNLAIDETLGEGKNRTEDLINVLAEQTVNYNIEVGEGHSFSFLGGVTIQKENQSESYMSVRGFPNDLVQTLNAALIIDNAGSQATSWALLSYLSRLQYNYKLKYFLSGSIRADGSSRFGAKSRWGYFPSVSAAWILSEESFLQGSGTFVKLRASYGQTGNFNIGNFPWLSEFGQENYVLGLSSGGSEIGGLAPATLGNEDIRWEKTGTIDVGLELGFFNDQLSLEVDAYRSNTTDMLLTVPVPEVTGFSSALQNIGAVQNQGVEFSANGNMNFGELSLSVGGNISFNQNKVISLGPEDAPIIVRGGSEGALYITRVGNEIGSYYTFVRDGIFTSQQELDNYPHLPGTQVGDARVLDLNQDGELSEDDRAITGNYFPDYIFGFNARMSWKGIDLNAQLQGVQGNEVMNLQRRYVFNMEGHQNNMAQAANRYVSASDPGDGVTPRAYKGVKGNSGLISDWMIEDGSFVRIRNITLGYTLPDFLTSKVAVSNARIYASAQNPFTFSNYTGFNPEVSGSYNGSGSLARGEDYGTYPLARTISFGINLTF